MSIFSICRFIIAVAERGEAGNRADQRRQVHARVADGGDLDLLVAVLADRIEPEEREEEVGLDPFHAGPVGHDQAGIDPLERALGDHDRDLLDGLRLLRSDVWCFEHLGHRVRPF
jgi:hypothetical protein